MLVILNAVGLLFAAVLLVPTTVFVCEICGGLLARTRKRSPGIRSGAGVDIIVPAHDEEAGIARTLRSLRAQTNPEDRIIVVADNCVDGTALVARREGALVVERNEPTMRGKGHALHCGLQFSEADARPSVVFVDADCTLSNGALRELVACCEAMGRPVQALYSMRAPEGAKVNLQVAEFAWRVRNDVRPSGMLALNWPCQLMGSGMAIPRAALQQVDLRTGHIVEDLQLGLDLALAGFPPVFWPAARVQSEFPVSAQGVADQRQRWETGHLRLAASRVPHCLAAGIAKADWSLIVMALDLAVPPVALLGMLNALSFLLTFAVRLAGGGSLGVILSGTALAMFIASLVAAWIVVGRSCLPAASLARTVPYVFAKSALYGRALVRRRASGWVRAERS